MWRMAITARRPPRGRGWSVARPIRITPADEEYNWFLAVLFPAHQLQVLAYNRMVRDLNGLTKAAFLEEVRRRFPVTEQAAAASGGARIRQHVFAGARGMD
jgi:uncharacterized protein (DUF1015 family)